MALLHTATAIRPGGQREPTHTGLSPHATLRVELRVRRPLEHGRGGTSACRSGASGRQCPRRLPATNSPRSVGHQRTSSHASHQRSPRLYSQCPALLHTHSGRPDWPPDGHCTDRVRTGSHCRPRQGVSGLLLRLTSWQQSIPHLLIGLPYRPRHGGCTVAMPHSAIDRQSLVQGLQAQGVRSRATVEGCDLPERLHLSRPVAHTLLERQGLFCCRL